MRNWWCSNGEDRALHADRWLRKPAVRVAVMRPDPKSLVIEQRLRQRGNIPT